MLFRTLALAVLAATMAVGQGRGGGGRPWWESSVINTLNLTDAQRTRIQKITGDYRTRMADARAAVDKAEADMHGLFDEGNVDEKRTTEAIDHLVKARGDLTRMFSHMTLKLRNVLTSEQWQELQKRQPQSRRPNSSAPAQSKHAPGQ